MEFLNIGGGEILVIILLAIILFGPEDILKIMRTVGNYVRKIQRMWAQVSAGLRGEFLPDEIIPEEVQEVITETKVSVDEVKATLNEVQTTVQTDIDDTKATVEEVKDSLQDVDTTVKSDLRTIPQSLRETARDAVRKKTDTQPENEPDPESVHLIAALLDDSSGSNSDEPEDETESTLAKAETTAEVPGATTTDTDEVAEAVVPGEDAPPDNTDTDEVAPVTVGKSTPGDEPDPTTVSLIASLLEPKSKETHEQAEDVESETATEAAETVTDIAQESAPEVIPEPVEEASISPSEPVTATTPPDEEV